MFLSFIRYNSMPLLYNFEIDTTTDILQLLAMNLQKRRLEKGLSREALSELSGVPAPTIQNTSPGLQAIGRKILCQQTL